MSELPLDLIAIDVGSLVQRTVASLYSHLVTRQTGRAVRLAIESQLAEAGERSLSLIDLSEVTILDFSCADEVVAKLLLRYQDAASPAEAFFVFQGVLEPHRDQVEVVLKRQSLAAVAETTEGTYELIGAHTDEEARAWNRLEGEGLIARDDAESLGDAGDREVLDRLVERRLAFCSPITGRYHALSRLVDHLM